MPDDAIILKRGTVYWVVGSLIAFLTLVLGFLTYQHTVAEGIHADITANQKEIESKLRLDLSIHQKALKNCRANAVSQSEYQALESGYAQAQDNLLACNHAKEVLDQSWNDINDLRVAYAKIEERTRYYEDLANSQQTKINTLSHQNRTLKNNIDLLGKAESIQAEIDSIDNDLERLARSMYDRDINERQSKVLQQRRKTFENQLIEIYKALQAF